MKIATLCLLTGALLGPVHAQEIEVFTRFTDFFVESGSVGTHPVFKRLSDDPRFRRDVNRWTQDALAAAEGLSFVALDLDGVGAGISRKVPPNAVFIRGLVSRADVQRVEHFALNEFVFSTNATLEIFDLASGEVFYTRTLTGQLFRETPKEDVLEDAETAESFRTCLKGTIEALAKQTGDDYRPGVIVGHVVAVIDPASVVVDLGRTDGVVRGMSLYLYGDPSAEAVGLVQAGPPQESLSLAGVVVPGPKEAERGWTVRGFGVNRMNAQKQQTRYQVASVSLGDPAHMSPEFNVDSQDLGQWLHDGLSRHTGLYMLAPLLATLDSAGTVRLQEALWNAQMAYSVFGGLAQSAVLGRRAFPEVLINGVITYAQVQHYTTPAADNLILRVGVSVEFYDRRTRDFLFSLQHSGRTVEKIVKEAGVVYRDVDLSASFRSLCKAVIREAAQLVGERYRPEAEDGSVIRIGEGGDLAIRLRGQRAAPGDLFQVLQETRRIAGLNGEDLGALQTAYGIVKLGEASGEGAYSATLLVSDGSTEVRAGDLLRAEGRQTGGPAGDLCRVEGWRVAGKVCEEFDCAPPRLTEWLHNALLATGIFRMLPPISREADATTAEVAMASGQFTARDQKEIIFQGSRSPAIVMTGRVGLADVTREEGKFKDVLKLRAGVEVTFATAEGDTLLSQKLAGTREVELVKARGQTMIGTADLGPEFDGLVENTIRELVERMAEEWEKKRR